MFIEPTPRIREIQEIVKSYRARCKEEDRGDHFKTGTPNEVIQYEKEISEFYRSRDTGPNGEYYM